MLIEPFFTVSIGDDSEITGTVKKTDTIETNTIEKIKERMLL
jgi:hypothetical protein